MFEKRTLEGAWLALAAYTFWGVSPVYFKWVTHVPPWEILAHRVFWSLLLLFAMVTLTKGWKMLRVSRQSLSKLAITSLLLAANWFIFIWAILHNNITETSLGYFINPLVSLFLGMIFLGERLRPLQWIAISIAASGICYQLLFHDAIPWIALTLAFTFGFYGLIRKNLNLPSVPGLTIEALLATPFAIAYLIWLSIEGTSSFGTLDTKTDLLLMAGGFVTAFPLLCFAAAVTRLSLTATGMYQYLAPSISLIIAVSIYDEPFGPDRLITFSCIWIALIIFASESFYYQKKRFSALGEKI